MGKKLARALTFFLSTLFVTLSFVSFLKLKNFYSNTQEKNEFNNEVELKNDLSSIFNSDYTVEFYYEDYEYIMDGNSTVKLDTILSSLNIRGIVSNVEISNPLLFSHEIIDSKYYIHSYLPFDNEQWMNVICDGIEYKIKVTDDYPAAYDLTTYGTKTDQTVTAADKPLADTTLVYDMADHALLVSPATTNAPTTGSDPVTIYYAIQDTTKDAKDWDWSDEYPKAKNAGTYCVYFIITGNDDFNSYSSIAAGIYTKVTIEKATPIITTLPTAKTGLVYTGSPQAVINDGVSNYGTITYSKDGTSYFEASHDDLKIPNAGTYSIRYKISEGANWKELDTGSSISVTINQAESTATWLDQSLPSFVSLETSTKSDYFQKPTISDLAEEAENTFEYSITAQSSDNYFTIVNKNTNQITVAKNPKPGTYEVSISAKTASASHNYASKTVTSKVTITIDKRDNSLSGNTNPESTEFSEYSRNTSITVTTSSYKGTLSGTITSISPSCTSFTLGTDPTKLRIDGKTQVGTYTLTIQLTASGNDYYKEVTISFDKQIQITQKELNLNAIKRLAVGSVGIETVYNKSNQDLFKRSYTEFTGTTIEYGSTLSSTTAPTTWATTIPQGKNADDNYWVWCKLQPGVNYSLATDASSITTGLALWRTKIAKADDELKIDPLGVVVLDTNPQTVSTGYTIKSGIEPAKTHETGDYSLIENLAFTGDKIQLTITNPSDTNAHFISLTFAPSRTDPNYNPATPQTIDFIIFDGKIFSISSISTTYDGKKHELVVPTFTDSKIKIEFKNAGGTYYTSPIPSVTNVGEVEVVYRVTYEGRTIVGDKSGTKIKVTAKNINDASITYSQSKTYQYSGYEQTLEFTLLDTEASKSLVETTDFTILTSSNKGKNVDSYNLTVIGTGNYTGTLTKEWKIEKFDLANARVVLGSVPYFETDPVVPSSIRVYNNSVEISETIEYTKVISNNDRVGNASIVFTAVPSAENYKGTKTVNYLVQIRPVYVPPPATASPAPPETTFYYETPKILENVRYTGEKVKIIYGGSTSKGTMYYGLSENEKVFPKSWDVNPDQVIEPGYYYVWYKIEDDKKVNLLGNVYLGRAEVIKGILTVIPPEGIRIKYTGEMQNLVNPGSTKQGHGTFEYSLDRINFTSDIPQGSELGEYKVYYRVAGDDYYEGTEIDAVKSTIYESLDFNVKYLSSDGGVKTQEFDDEINLVFELDGGTWVVNTTENKIDNLCEDLDTTIDEYDLSKEDYEFVGWDLKVVSGNTYQLKAVYTKMEAVPIGYFIILSVVALGLSLIMFLLALFTRKGLAGKIIIAILFIASIVINAITQNIKGIVVLYNDTTYYVAGIFLLQIILYFVLLKSKKGKLKKLSKSGNKKINTKKTVAKKPVKKSKSKKKNTKQKKKPTNVKKAKKKK